MLPLLLPSAARAGDEPCCRPIPHWYGAIGGSAVFLTDSDIAFHPHVFSNISSNYSVGYGVSGAIGYRFDSNVREELEVAYRENELRRIDGASVTTSPGYYYAATSLAVMANSYYDFRNDSSLTPYLGAGLGEKELSHQHVWALAYQLMAGINYEVPNQPLEFIFGYRYVSGRDVSIPLPAPPITKISFANTSHNLEFGMRVFFK